MQVREGYKQTEVGVVPDDWEVGQLKDLIAIKSGFAFSSAHFSDKGAILLTPGNFKLEGGLYFGDRNTKRYSAAYSPSMTFNFGDLLIVMTDLTPDCKLLGKPAFVDIFEPILHNQRIGKIIPKNKRVSLAFLFWHFMSNAHALRMKETATGSTVRHTSNKSIYSSLLALPSIPAEQAAIATALSDVDALLATQDKLIAKKRDIKQATMQQLLTGKQRLPGFTGEWEVKRLGDVFNISAGKSKSAYIATSGRYWVVDMGSVSTAGKLIVSKLTNFEGDFLKLGDLVMPKDDIGGGGIIGRAGYIDANETYVLGDHVYRLMANMGDSLFLSYLINAHPTNTELRKKVIGSAQLGLGRKSVDEQEIPFPSLEEQTAIATVLADMDADLTVLEQQRDKTHALKQGMMQELLTGRIRLV